jgi:hypothetical protein
MLLPIQSITLDTIVPEWRNWQTRMVQVHVLARVWGFESLLRHQSFIYDIDLEGFDPISNRNHELGSIIA